MWEISRQVKKEIVALVFTVATVIAIRIVSEPDSMKTAKMYSTDKLRKWSNKGALTFLDLADWADSEYEKARL